MNSCLNHPPIFPPWRGRLSPLIDTREREIEVVPRRRVFITTFLLSGLAWAIIFACIKLARG